MAECTVTKSGVCTFKEAKDILLGPQMRAKKEGAAQENAWMLYMPPPSHDYNEVYPHILLGNRSIPDKPEALRDIGVTHVVNCAQGKKFNQINTDAEFYKAAGIKFHGFVATDILTFKMTPHLEPAAEFIAEALDSGGKLYVHCISGVSRSATVVLAFLMLKRQTPLLDALKLVREKRKILPNDGFLQQLIDLNNKLYGQKSDQS